MKANVESIHTETKPPDAEQLSEKVLDETDCSRLIDQHKKLIDDWQNQGG